MWTLFAAWALFCVLDRFIGPIYLGSTNGGFLPPPCFKDGCLNFAALPQSAPLSLRFFDAYQRATGRLFVAVTPFLLITMCKTTENWFAEHHPSWLNIGDLRATNTRLHYQMALFFLAIPMAIHLFIIFVPVMAGIPIVFKSVHDAAEAGNLTPFIAANMSLFFEPKDFLRLPLAILTFFIILPLSVANWSRLKNFTTAHYLHLFGAALYFMDFLRGNHPHAQVLCAPIFIWYLIDRLVGIWVYRSGTSTICHIENLDTDYCVVFQYVPNQKRRRGVGSLYYYALPGMDGAGDFSHPYTSFQNHGRNALLEAWKDARDATSESHKFFVRSSEHGQKSQLNRRADDSMDSGVGSDVPLLSRSTHKDFEDDVVKSQTDDITIFENWNTAFIVQKFNSSKQSASFSRRLSEKRVGDRIRFWGPYYSEYTELTPLVGLPPLVLIATGAGVNYVLDYYTWLTGGNRSPSAPVQVYFSTNSISLLQFVTDLLCSQPVDNFAVSAHLTRHDNDLEVMDDAEDIRTSKRGVNLGRLSLSEVIQQSPANAEVYFCGSPMVQWELELICTRHNRAFHPGSRFSPFGTRDLKVINGKVKCKCTAFPFPFHY